MESVREVVLGLTSEEDVAGEFEVEVGVVGC